MNIPFIIGLIIVASIMSYVSVLCLNKNKKPRNKVRFFIRRDLIGFSLFIECKNGSRMYICSGNLSESFGLNLNDFSDMKGGENREVYINLED